MKELPSSVTIRGIRWNIKRVNNNHPALKRDKYSKERDYYGCCDKWGEVGPECTIYVRKDLTDQIAWETLLHEMLHAIAYGFKPFDLKYETPVEIAAGELLSILRQWKFL